MNILLRDRAGEIAFNAFYPDNTPLASHVTDGQDLWEDVGERTADETPIFNFCTGTAETAFQLDLDGIKNAKEAPESVEATARLEAANAAEAIEEIVEPPISLEASIQAGAEVAKQITEGAANDESKA